MKAISVQEPGDADVLLPVEIDPPRPGSGQVSIRLEAIGVNFADIMCRRADHPGMPTPPIIPGCEGSGVVEEIGPNCSRYQTGDRVVVYSPPGGTYAEFVAAPETYTLPLPDEMSFAEGAAFTHVFLTAYHALSTLGGAQPGEWVVVTAAAGGVGTAAIQLAQAWELKVIGCTGSVEKLALLKQMGVEDCVDYGTEDLATSIMEISQGGGADVVLESVGGPLFQKSLKALAPLGRLVLFGISSGESEPVNTYELLARSGTYATLNLSVIFAHSNSLILQSWNELIDLYRAGKIRPMIHHRFGLSEAAEAHRLMESRKSTGKILLLPG